MDSLTLPQIIHWLQQAYPDLKAKDIAEILWLAEHIKQDTSPGPTSDVVQLSNEEPVPPVQQTMPQGAPSLQLAPDAGRVSPPSPKISGKLYIQPHESDTTEYDYRTGYPIKVPTGSALPESLEISRSLRPLLHKVPSRTTRALNVSATARRIAETEKKVTMPVLQPALTRWLDVAMVIDVGASMVIWQKTIEELRKLLERLGAFRDVRIWQLATNDKKKVILYAGTSPQTQLFHSRGPAQSTGVDLQRRARNERELIDPGRQRLILVVTDCVSPAWHSGKVQEWLQLWGQKNIVTIVQMLPQPLWVRTALAYTDIIQVHAPSSGCINARLEKRYTFSQYTDEQDSLKRPVPIPVLTLEPGSSGAWAKMITGVEEAWSTGVIFHQEWHEEFPQPTQKREISPEKRVEQFRSTSSSMAVKLAGLLASAPISLPVMRLVQRALLPGSNQVQLAEILLSGLLKKAPGHATHDDPDYVEYEFLPGVRDLLRDPVPVPRSFEVLQTVSTFIAKHYGQRPEFEALVAPIVSSPGAADAVPISIESRPFALVASGFWRRFGGNYVGWADRIEQRAMQVGPGPTDQEMNAVLEPTSHFEPNLNRVVSDAEPLLSEGSTNRNTEPFILFARNPLFQVRQGEFELLEALLFGSESAHPLIVGITGLAGIGKTQLAVELAYRYLDRFSEGIFWMPAIGKNLLDWQRPLAELGMKTNYLPPDDDPTSAENERRRAEHFCRYLADHKNALLILDNVEEPDLVMTVLPAMTGKEPACTILYTSRNPNVPTGALQYIVQVLPEQAALRLLLETTHPDLLPDLEAQRTNPDIEAARSLCQYVGYLPLALVLLRDLLAHPKTLAELVSELAQNRSLDIIETLFQTLRLSWRYIDKRARDLFMQASCFPETTPIPLWLLGIVSDLGENSPGVKEAYTQLCAMSFMEALSSEQVRLHPLVREFGRRMILEEGDEDGGLQEKAIQLLTDEFVDLNRLEQRALREGYWRCQEQVRIAHTYTEMLETHRGEQLKEVERWLARESYLLADKQWWPRAIPGLFYQQLYNHAVEGNNLRLTGNPPEKWLYQEEAVRAEDQVLLQIFVGHKDRVLSVAFSPDGLHVLTGSDDGTAALWEASSGRMLRRLKGHKASVWSVAFSPDGLLVLTGSADKTARLWGTESGQEVRHLVGHTSMVSSVALSPDGRRVFTGSWDETARLWDVSSGEEIERLHTNRVDSVAFSPDGQRVLTGLVDGKVQVWDIESGEELQQFVGHNDEVNSVAFSPDGSRVLSGSHDRTARVWDGVSGDELLRLEGHSEPVSGVAFSADGRWILTGSWDETVRIWDAIQGQEFIRLEGHQDKVRGVAFAPGGKRVVTGSDDETARLWAIEGAQTPVSLQDQMDMVECMAMSADGQRILTGTNEGMIRIWDASSGRELAHWEGHTSSLSSVAFSPNGQRILAGTLNGSVSLWEGVPGRLLESLPGRTDAVTCVAFSPDGLRILTGSRDGILQLWSTESRTKLLVPPIWTGDAVTCSAFSLDGRRILTGSADGTVKIWDGFSGQEISRLFGHTAPINSVAISRDGARALTSSDDGTVRLWEISSQWQLAAMNSSQAPLRNAMFSPDNQLAIACDDHGWVFLWQITGVEIGKLQGLYVASWKIGAVYWVDATHLLLVDTGGSHARPHFYHLRLEGKW